MKDQWKRAYEVVIARVNRVLRKQKCRACRFYVSWDLNLGVTAVDDGFPVDAQHESTYFKLAAKKENTPWKKIYWGDLRTTDDEKSIVEFLLKIAREADISLVLLGESRIMSRGETLENLLVEYDMTETGS